MFVGKLYSRDRLEHGNADVSRQKGFYAAQGFEVIWSTETEYPFDLGKDLVYLM